MHCSHIIETRFTLERQTIELHFEVRSFLYTYNIASIDFHSPIAKL